MGRKKGFKITEETRKKMSEAKFGEKNINFGKHLSKEVREKLSKSKKGITVFTIQKECELCGKEITAKTTTQKICKDCKDIRDNNWKKEYLKNSLRMKQHLARGIAFRKILLNETCDICSSNEELTRHHWNYEKPLLVNTLCNDCHTIQHIKQFDKSRFGSLE